MTIRNDWILLFRFDVDCVWNWMRNKLEMERSKIEMTVMEGIYKCTAIEVFFDKTKTILKRRSLGQVVMSKPSRINLIMNVH